MIIKPIASPISIDMLNQFVWRLIVSSTIFYLIILSRICLFVKNYFELSSKWIVFSIFGPYMGFRVPLFGTDRYPNGTYTSVSWNTGYPYLRPQAV